MNNRALFSSKDKSKKLKCLLQFLCGALRVIVPNKRQKFQKLSFAINHFESSKKRGQTV